MSTDQCLQAVNLGGCCPEEIMDHLNHVLSSGSFDCSARNRKFLAYVVEESLQGRASRIKAYAIATTVFGRDESFDSQLDSIVRIEAGRLRRALERYYLTGGANDPIRITIPNGTYAPSFSRAGSGVSTETAGPVATERHGWALERQTSIIVMPFEEEGDQTAYPSITRGFTRQLVVGLTRFINLNVFVGPSVLADASSVRLPQQNCPADFILTGGTTISADRFVVDVLLTEAATGRSVWSASYDRVLEPVEVYRTRNEVASSIAGTLGQPYGILDSHVAQDAEGKVPGHMASLEAVNLFHRYWRTYDPGLLGPAVAGLETAVQTDPEYAEAFVCLSLAMSNSVRFGPVRMADAIGPLRRARDLAHHAIELTPQSSRGYFAMAVASWFGGDVGYCLNMLETGLTLNPNDTETMAELGMRYSNRADWARAVPLLEAAYRRNPALPTSFRVGLSLWHYVNGRYEDALAEATRMDTEAIVYTHVVRAIAANKLCRKAETEWAIATILKLHPDYAAHAEDDLRYRNVDRHLADAVLAGLHDAGLPIIARHAAALKQTSARTGPEKTAADQSGPDSLAS
jgi:TolB-like protein